MRLTDYSLIDKYSRHGGAYDRGGADSWYLRPRDPHYYTGGSYQGDRIPEEKMSKEEIEAYHQGYDDNEKSGGHKEYF